MSTTGENEGVDVDQPEPTELSEPTGSVSAWKRPEGASPREERGDHLAPAPLGASRPPSPTSSPTSRRGARSAPLEAPGPYGSPDFASAPPSDLASARPHEDEVAPAPDFAPADPAEMGSDEDRLESGALVGPDLLEARVESPVSPRPPAGVYPPQTLIAGKYRIEGAIARGGMGQVYLATQLPLGRQVALKLVMQQPGDAAFRERFLLEASTCARLSHTNIVAIFDYGETERGDLYTVMEYLGRVSLARLIRQERRLSAFRTCSFALQIGRALKAAHRAGVVHRDLKPSNVMLVEDPEGGTGFELVKVVDFGLAKTFDGDAATAARLTRAGMLLGSPRYMSPEQVRNRSIDPRSDIYALGAMMFHMLTGRPPFDGEHPSEIMAQQLRDPPPPMAEVAPHLEVPPILEALVQRCLRKRPEERPQRVEEINEELRAIVDQLGGDLPDAARLLEHTAANPRTLVTRRPAEAAEATSSGPSSGSSVWWGVAIVLASVVSILAFWAAVLT